MSLHPNELLTINDTSNTPELENKCEGFSIKEIAPSKSSTLGIRPEHLSIIDQNSLSLNVETVEQLGSDSFLYGKTTGNQKISIKISILNFAALARARIFDAVVSAPLTLKTLTLTDCNRR